MSTNTLRERAQAMVPRYEEMFASPDDVTPTDPLKFHLYHLARYWSRLVGFCRQMPSKPAEVIDTDLGACVLVGSEFVHSLIELNSPIYARWQDYWTQTQKVLFDRPVTLEAVESASQAFNDCLAELKYDPWERTPD